jgi:hypothetical protein
MSYRIIIAAFLIVGFKTTILYCQVTNSDSMYNKIEYIPKNFELNKIDTTINDSIKLNVRHYTLMDSFATAFGENSDSIIFRYRDYEIAINMTIKGKEIINKKLLKSDFITDEKYWPNLTIFKIWLKSSDVESSSIKLRIGIGIPNFNTPVIASLFLGYDGSTIIKLK